MKFIVIGSYVDFGEKILSTWVEGVFDDYLEAEDMQVMCQQDAPLASSGSYSFEIHEVPFYD